MHRPAIRPALPDSKKSDFQRPMDCSDTFSRRAASAIVISPARTLNTIRIFFSTGITGDLLIVFRLAFTELDQQLTSLPHSLTRDANTAWVRNYRTAIAPFTSGGVYLNFIGNEGVEGIKSAFGAEQYERLTQIKSEYDPGNVFAGNHNISPKVPA